jgi:hypothetical protein
MHFGSRDFPGSVNSLPRICLGALDNKWSWPVDAHLEASLYATLAA